MRRHDRRRREEREERKEKAHEMGVGRMRQVRRGMYRKGRGDNKAGGSEEERDK